jgi:hypothetical protein
VLTQPATNKRDHLLEVREQARLRGDRGVYRACTADLARLGHVDPPAAPAPAPVEPQETTQIEQPERAVPPPKRRRPARTTAPQKTTNK